MRRGTPVYDQSIPKEGREALLRGVLETPSRLTDGVTGLTWSNSESELI